MNLRIVILSSLLLFFNSCDDPVSSRRGGTNFLSEQNPYTLNGTVVDEFNSPVAAADIHFLFPDFFYPSLTFQKATPQTTISFSIAEESHVTMTVYRLGTREKIATLIDTVLRAGNYAHSHNTSMLTNGFYIYQIVSEKFFIQKLMFHSVLDFNALLKTNPVVRTNFEGKFKLPQSVFGFEEEFQFTSEQSPQILYTKTIDSVGLVMYRQDKKPLIEWIKLNKQGNIERTFILK